MDIPLYSTLLCVPYVDSTSHLINVIDLTNIDLLKDIMSDITVLLSRPVRLLRRLPQCYGDATEKRIVKYGTRYMGTCLQVLPMLRHLRRAM